MFNAFAAESVDTVRCLSRVKVVIGRDSVQVLSGMGADCRLATPRNGIGVGLLVTAGRIGVSWFRF